MSDEMSARMLWYLVGRYVVHSRSKESRSNLVKTSDCKEMEIVTSIHTAAHHLSNITFIHSSSST